MQPDKPFRILHFGLLKTLSSGIKAQLDAEESAAGHLSDDIEWRICFFSHDAVDRAYMKRPAVRFPLFKHHPLGKYLRLRLGAYQWLRENAGYYDAILLRHPLGDPLLPHYLKDLNNVFTVHHTNELGEIDPNESWAKYIQYRIEQRAGKAVLGRTNGIVALTGEILEAEQKRAQPDPPAGYISPNGIDLNNIMMPQDRREGPIKLVSLCSKPYPWQGLDLITAALKGSDKQNIEIHLIGDISPQTFGSDPRLHYHGMVPHAQLAAKLGQFDLGLGSFALERKSMKEACTLKTREYLAAGLPVYAHHRDSGLPVDFPYFINAPFDVERAIDLAKTFRAIPRETIREMAAPYIDKHALLQRLAEWLKKQSRPDQVR